jgi:hypothetical protein
MSSCCGVTETGPRCRPIRTTPLHLLAAGSGAAHPSGDAGAIRTHWLAGLELQHQVASETRPRHKDASAVARKGVCTKGVLLELINGFVATPQPFSVITEYR